MNEKKTKTEKIQRRLANLKPFKPGQSGNPAGRPKGKRNFWTDFSEAWRRIAEQLRLNQEPDEGAVQILMKGIKMIFQGNTTLLEKFLDRLYGKPKETIEIENEIKIDQMTELETLLRELIETHKQEKWQKRQSKTL